jgi:hypothetical protein
MEIDSTKIRQFVLPLHNLKEVTDVLTFGKHNEAGLGLVSVVDGISHSMLRHWEL